MECYVAIERNTFESVVVRWMNLEPLIQSEVIQKEKNKYYILIHIYIYRERERENLGKCTDESIFRAGIETQTGIETNIFGGRRGGD